MSRSHFVLSVPFVVKIPIFPSVRFVRSVVKLLLFESNPPVGTLTPSATEEQSSSIYRSMP